MKIAIVAPSPIPFVIGGAEKLFWGMLYQMNQLTHHEVELIKIPCRDREFWTLMEGYVRASRLDLSYFDMVITTKYPAWMVPHRNHHLYLQHTCRGVYDLYHYHLPGAPLDIVPTHRELEPLCLMLNISHPDRSLLEPFFGELFRLRGLKALAPETFAYPGPLTRAVIRWLDRIALAPEQIATYHAISRNVALREGYFPPGCDIEIIHHPSDLEGFHSTGHDYIFTASRFDSLKRVGLLIEAFKSVDADIEFLIAGTGEEEKHLKSLAADDPRICFLGFITDSEMIKYYAGALFVPFVPYDEDYGLITVEAMQSSKAILTTLDSGGVNELVKDGQNGRVVPPDVEAVAETMTELISDRERTIQMGVNGKESVASINWHNTIFALLGEDAAGAPRIRTRRKKIVGTTTFPIYPPRGGGQKRIYHLYRELALKVDCVFVTLAQGNHAPSRTTLSPGFIEVALPKSQAQDDHIGNLQSSLMASIEDIAAIDGYRLNPDYLSALSRECRDADIVIASHPYLYRAIRKVYSGRLWYEAHNVEYDMKTVVLPESPQRSEYLGLVREVERQCCLDAELILSVSDEDKARIMEIYGIEDGKILIVRNGMDFRGAAACKMTWDEKRSLKQRLGFGSRPVALFMGSYHGPNIDAMDAIITIAPQLPKYLFLIVGSVCLHGEACHLPENVKLLGVLDEEEKAVALNVSDIALNPVRGGSGSNLKLLEYVAYGIPVITTPHGNRGYGLMNKEHLMVAETVEFSTILRDLPYADPLRLQAMASNARQFASSRYDWSLIALCLSNFFS